MPREVVLSLLEGESAGLRVHALLNVGLVERGQGFEVSHGHSSSLEEEQEDTSHGEENHVGGAHDLLSKGSMGALHTVRL